MAGDNNERQALLADHGLSDEQFKQTGLQWEMLDAIRESHINEASDLRDSAEYVYKRLLTLPDVHSLKVRVKAPDHLVTKVIRKKLREPELEITADNYRDHVTDLIGIRALHLFKAQWQPIHDFIMAKWGRELLHEDPIAYIRKGDSGVVVEAQEKAGCRVQEHPFGYRSVHYLVRSQPAKVTRITELQVRTVFEEGWSEIDHQVRYPRTSDDPLLGELTVLFNRLAGSADEMGTFIKILSVHLREQSANQLEQQKRMAASEEKVKKLINESKASDKEKAELQKEVAKLRKEVANSTTTMDYVGMGGLLGSNSSITLLGGKFSSDVDLSSVWGSEKLARSLGTTPNIADTMKITSGTLRFKGTPTCSKCGNTMLLTGSGAYGSGVCEVCAAK